MLIRATGIAVVHDRSKRICPCLVENTAQKVSRDMHSQCSTPILHFSGLQLTFPTFPFYNKAEQSRWNEQEYNKEAMAQCLSEVYLRIPEHAAVDHLCAADNYALLNWEAEHYRQKLEQSNTSNVADN